jgi:hypothetical protein
MKTKPIRRHGVQESNRDLEPTGGHADADDGKCSTDPLGSVIALRPARLCGIRSFHYPARHFL